MKHIDDQAINNPLSKEDLRKQFIEQTEKLGLKHTFTFFPIFFSNIHF